LCILVSGDSCCPERGAPVARLSYWHAVSGPLVLHRNISHRARPDRQLQPSVSLLPLLLTICTVFCCLGDYFWCTHTLPCVCLWLCCWLARVMHQPLCLYADYCTGCRGTHHSDSSCNRHSITTVMRWPWLPHRAADLSCIAACCIRTDLDGSGTPVKANAYLNAKLVVQQHLQCWL
jgi:hypothetical protein